jgi:hypothetical protein
MTSWNAPPRRETHPSPQDEAAIATDIAFARPVDPRNFPPTPIYASGTVILSTILSESGILLHLFIHAETRRLRLLPFQFNGRSIPHGILLVLAVTAAHCWHPRLSFLSSGSHVKYLMLHNIHRSEPQSFDFGSCVVRVQIIIQNLQRHSYWTSRSTPPGGGVHIL